MHLNEFAADRGPLDMTASDEFASLLQSAADLGIPHVREVRYVSRNVVVNHLRLHLLEWGDPAAPPVILLHGGNQSAHSWDLVNIPLMMFRRSAIMCQDTHSSWSQSSTSLARNSAIRVLAQRGRMWL